MPGIGIAVAELGITGKETKPYRPQANAKIERFHRALTEGWAFKEFYDPEPARRAARPDGAFTATTTDHTPLGKATPSSG